MASAVLYEVIRRSWSSQSSSTPYLRPEFSHELTNSGLYAYCTYTDSDPDSRAVYCLDTCWLSNERLQGLLQYIQEKRLALSEEAAFDYLLDCIRKARQKTPKSCLPAIFGGLPVLTALICALIISFDGISHYDSFLPQALHATLTAVPLLWLILLLIKAPERTITAACEAHVWRTPEEYCKALHSLELLISKISTNRFYGVSKVKILFLLTWLAVAACFIFFH